MAHDIFYNIYFKIQILVCLFYYVSGGLFTTFSNIGLFVLLRFWWSVYYVSYCRSFIIGL